MKQEFSKMLCYALIALIFAQLVLGDAIKLLKDGKPYIKGLAPAARASLTFDATNFQCMDQSTTIPFSRVNDDFCDCPDGSDEPGTPACVGGQFWCRNAGYEGKYIFSSQVWDGICDCCDGSDEKEGKCEDGCQALALHAKQAKIEELQVHKQGLATKRQWIEEAKAALEGKRKKLGELESELEKLKQEEVAAKEQKESAEAAEKAERARIEEEERRIDEELAREEAEAELAKEGKEDNEAKNVDETQAETTSPEETKEDEAPQEPEPEEPEPQETEDLDAVFDDEDELQPFIDATQAASDALKDIQGKIKDVEKEIGQIKDLLEQDFGPSNEFYPLHGQCYSTTTNEYTYELCPYDKATQKTKSGGGGTSLGKWERSKQGEEWSQQHRVMKFTGGQKCWGGPDRSMTVEVLCGKETKVSDPAEPNKCEYSLKLHTPAACSEGHVQALELDMHESIHDDFI